MGSYEDSVISYREDTGVLTSENFLQDDAGASMSHERKRFDKVDALLGAHDARVTRDELRADWKRAGTILEKVSFHRKLL